MEIIRRRTQQPTFQELDRIIQLLDEDVLFFPFLTAVGTDIWPYGTPSVALSATPSDEGGAVALESEFDPIRLPSGIYAYYFDSSANNHLNVADNAGLSFEGGGDDAFSLGCWIYPTSAFASAQSLIAKYGSTAAAEEYDLRIDTSSQIVFELHDASASASEIATGADGDTVTSFQWNFICATYDGTAATPSVHLYLNGEDENAAGTTVETGAYVALEDTAATLMIGARDATGTPAQEFEGYMAMPFITAIQLSAANVAGLYSIGKRLIGL